MERYHKTTVDTTVLYTKHVDAQCRTSVVQNVAELITLSRYAEAQVERCQQIVTERSEEQFMTHVKIMRTKMGRHKSFPWLDQKFLISIALN